MSGNPLRFKPFALYLHACVRVRIASASISQTHDQIWILPASRRPISIAMLFVPPPP